MQTDEHRCTQSDHMYITHQLGREPKGVIAVAARGRDGRPRVIKNQPLIRRGQQWLPFPTLYWLVDPQLHAQLAEIERKGGVRMIEQVIANDPTHLTDHRQDNACYAQARWGTLSSTEQQTARDLGIHHILQNTGIGGVANHDAIKCLHTQYAYHLACHEIGTTAGRLIQQQFGLG